MEKNLEHKIKEAFHKKDELVNYPRKEELWNKIENSRKTKKGVPAFWRIAAVLLAIFFITGAFAGLVVIFKTQNLNGELEYENKRLEYALDSLQSIQPEVLTKTKIIEKEVPVYVQPNALAQSSAVEKAKMEELNKRNVDLQIQFKTEKTLLKNEIDSLKKELLALKAENQTNTTPSPQTKNESGEITLKSENYDTLYQKKPNTGNPKIKLQLFNNPAQKEQVQINSSIFKK